MRATRPLVAVARTATRLLAAVARTATRPLATVARTDALRRFLITRKDLQPYSKQENCRAKKKYINT